MTDYYPNIVPYFLMDGEKYDDPFNLLLDVILSGSSDVNTAFVNLAAEVQKNGASSTAFTQMNALQSLLRTVKTADGQTLDTWLLERFRGACEFGSLQHDRLRVIRVFVHGQLEPVRFVLGHDCGHFDVHDEHPFFVPSSRGTISCRRSCSGGLRRLVDGSCSGIAFSMWP